MNTKLFRKASIDRVNSPEQLNEYIRVANPGVWLVLAAAIALLVGMLIWGIFGTVETTIEAGVVVDDGTAVCYVSAREAQRLAAGMPVSTGEVSGTVASVAAAPTLIDDALSDRDRLLLGFARGGHYYAVQLSLPGVTDGVYPAVITVESISPISFLLH